MGEKVTKTEADDPRPKVRGVFVDLNAPSGGNGSALAPYNLKDLKNITASDLKTKYIISEIVESKYYA